MLQTLRWRQPLHMFRLCRKLQEYQIQVQQGVVQKHIILNNLVTVIPVSLGVIVALLMP